MKTLNCLIFATITFAATAHADPITDLSTSVTVQLNSKLNQISSEMANELQVSLDNQMSQMIEEFAASRLESVDAEQAASHAPAVIHVTAKQAADQEVVQ